MDKANKISRFAIQKVNYRIAEVESLFVRVQDILSGRSTGIAVAVMGMSPRDWAPVHPRTTALLSPKSKKHKPHKKYGSDRTPGLLV